MKPATVWFIIAEVVDIYSTKINLSIPAFYEANPLMARLNHWVDVKILVTVIICLAIEKFDFGKRAFLVPMLAFIPPLWNIGLLIYYLVR